MKELDELCKRSADRRKSKNEELFLLLNKKRQDSLDAFDKEYSVALEDLAAKDGTGKKYGRPKRLA